MKNIDKNKNQTMQFFDSFISIIGFKDLIDTKIKSGRYKDLADVKKLKEVNEIKNSINKQKSQKEDKPNKKKKKD